MLIFGRLLQAVGLVSCAVGLANGLGVLVTTLRGDAAISGYADFALPIALAGLVPGLVLYWLGRRLVRKVQP